MGVREGMYAGGQSRLGQRVWEFVLHVAGQAWYVGGGGVVGWCCMGHISVYFNGSV